MRPVAIARRLHVSVPMGRGYYEAYRWAGHWQESTGWGWRPLEPLPREDVVSDLARGMVFLHRWEP